MAKVIVDIPDEMWNTLQIGQYQMGYAEYVARYVEKGKLIPSNATNGDVIKAMFPDATISELKSKHERTKVAVEWGFEAIPSYYNLFYQEWWNASYKTESEDE